MKKVFSTKNLIVILLTYIGVMIVGAFMDLDLSVLICNQDSFIAELIFITAYMPLGFFFLFGGLLMIYGDNHKVKAFTIIRYIIAFCALCCSVFYLFIENEGASLVLQIIEFIIVIILAFIAGAKCKKRSKEMLTRFSLFILATTVISCWAIGITKMVVCRPRYEWLLTSGLKNYRGFYQIDKTLKETSIAAGVSKEMFKSFPSGHTCSVAMLSLMFTLPILFNSPKKRCELLYFVGVVLMIITGLTRIIAGAHFLSDVATGAFIAYFVMFIVEKIFIKKYE